MIGILLTLPLSQQSLVIDKINAETGYAQIQTDEVEIVNTFDIVLHLISPKEILEIVEELERNINLTITDSKKAIATHQIEHIRNEIKTLIPRRHKRGLVNLGGTVLKWVFGTMDETDKKDIEEHLNAIDTNNHELIENNNQQIKINNKFNKTFELIKNTIETDRSRISERLNTITKRTYHDNLFLEQLIKIDLIKRQIENIQDNLVSARIGIIHPSILTAEEIETYDIDSKKLTQIRLGVARYMYDTIVFIIKIPKTFEKFNKKLIVPIANSNEKQIDQDIELVIEKDSKFYSFENGKTFKELRLSKNCIYKGNCMFTTSPENEQIIIDDNIIILNNAIQKDFNSTCDNRKMTLNGNFFINFQNCSIQIGNEIFNNKANKIFSRFVIPTTSIPKNRQKDLTFEDLVVNQENNIEEIKELRYQKNVNIGIGISSLFICFLLGLLIWMTLCIRKGKYKTKLLNRIQENPGLNGGGVTWQSIEFNRMKIDDPAKNRVIDTSKIDGTGCLSLDDIKIQN